MTDNTNNPFEEISQPDIEKDEVQQITDIAVKLLDKRYTSQDKKVLRGVHPKSHGCIQATFKINDDLDKKYQVGLFSTPGKEYKSLVRFSNATVTVEDDLANGENASRGMAIKVLDVEGDEPFLQTEAGARNQDFLMINTASFVFSDVSDYLVLNKVLLRDNDSADGFFADPSVCPQRVQDSLAVVQEVKSLAVENPVGVQYFGAAPFLFGPDRVMRFSVKPSDGVKPQKVPTNPAANYLKDALVETMSKENTLKFDFMVQVRNAGESGLEIENAAKTWSEEEFKFVTIATLTITAPQAQVNSEQGEANCEALVFTPWHALASHQPLGGINRLRKNVYTASATHRDADDKGAICRFAHKSKE